jgi:hypothetical protein
MSETKEPYKWYWAYQSYPCELVPTEEVSTITGGPIYKNKYPLDVSETLHTYIFNTIEEAYAFADNDEAFSDCLGKEAFIEKYEEVLFEVNESELEDYAPVIFCLEKAA